MRRFHHIGSNASAGARLALPELEREAIMLWGLAILFVVLWGLGLMTSYTLGGFVHILLVLAVIVVVVRVIQGRRSS
jgi:hypothetical protein